MVVSNGDLMDPGDRLALIVATLNDPRHYRPRAQGYVELSPDRCSNGHPLGPARSPLDGSRVRCAEHISGAAGHRSWSCNECGADVCWPGCTRYGVQAWEGRYPA